MRERNGKRGWALIITAATPILLACLTMLQLYASHRVETVRTDLQVQTAGITAEVKAIHTAVNAERTAMTDEIRQMHATIQALELALERAQRANGRR